MCDEKTVVWSGPSSVKCNLNPTNYINTTALGDVECGRNTHTHETNGTQLHAHRQRNQSPHYRRYIYKV